jgi:DNA-binding winged helix-turn-helix (wHTH) protein
MLSAGDRSTPVEADEALFLRALGERPGGIVEPDALPEQIAGRTRALAATLRRERLPRIGSAARIITVPGIGYRLMGSVTVSAAAAAERP